MRVAFLFHKDPLAEPSGIDLIRLHALACGLRSGGVDAEIVAPVGRASVTAAGVPVRPLEHLRTARYDIVKTCYHFSIELVGDHPGPVVSRLVRVVDADLPERDATSRERLLRCQEAVASRADVAVFDDRENERRWRAAYGDRQRTALVPTGCPSLIPPPGPSPYQEGERAVLFLGSLYTPRMVAALNTLAEALLGVARVHHVGRDKLHLYGAGAERFAGAGRDDELSPLVVRHGGLPEERIWDFIRHAHVGLALAPGPHSFDNELAKLYSYLRGGLPVLCEERVANIHLLASAGIGDTFAYDDPDDAAARALALLRRPRRAASERAAAYMARAHSWDTRAATYRRLFTDLRA